MPIEDLYLNGCARKTRYKTPEAAGRGAESAHSKGSIDKLRVYPCQFCQGFHLTHTTLEEITT